MQVQVHARQFSNTAEMMADVRSVRTRLFPARARTITKPAKALESIPPPIPAPERETPSTGGCLAFRDYCEATKELDMPIVHDGPKRIWIESIIRATAEHFGISISDIKSHRRPRVISIPRQVCFYLCRKLTTRSLPEIGSLMGGKDHTVVIHGCRKTEARMLVDPVIADAIEMITARLKGTCDAA